MNIKQDLQKNVPTATETNILAGKHILIVEDDLFIARVYEKWLRKYKVVVEVASNGALGLKLLGIKQFDLMLLDLGMPGLDGYETLLQLRGNVKIKNVPVIILSNTTMMGNGNGFEAIDNVGVEAVLRKYETSLQNLIDSIVEVFKSRDINN